jgi:hypothetical protein
VSPEAPPPSTPLVSVVVTSRNDDHGGDPLARLQACIDSLARQASAHRLRIEFVLVEWNPPEDRPPIREVLAVPHDPPGFTLRVVTVPSELHGRLPHGGALPLFQMLAKNVGIRRATGDFILATNIDVILSEELAGLLAGPLRSGLFYRAFRFDIPTGAGWTVGRRPPRWGRVNGPAGTRERGRLPAWDVFLVSRSPLAGILLRSTRRAAVLGLDLAVGLVVRSAHRVLSAARRVARVLARPRRLMRLSALRRLGDAAAGVAAAALIAPRLLRRYAARLRSRRSRRIRPSGALWTVVTVRLGGLSNLIRTLRTLADLPFTNACGDFTLMSREDWWRLRGYPEWPIFSWHLDSVLLLQARAAGIVEVVLPPRLRAYHLDHELGSGYSPEGADVMFARLDRAGTPYLTNSDVLALASSLGSVGDGDPSTVAGPVLNLSGWGFAGEVLPEWTAGTPSWAPAPSLENAGPGR